MGLIIITTGNVTLCKGDPPRGDKLIGLDMSSTSAANTAGFAKGAKDYEADNVFLDVPYENECFLCFLAMPSMFF